jgi:hypothetical protein
MDCCASTSIEGVVATTVVTITIIITIVTTTLGELFQP